MAAKSLEIVGLVRRNHAFEAAQQLLLRHAVESKIGSSSAGLASCSPLSPLSAVIIGVGSASGSSTSTCFCSEWMRSSLRSPGETVSSAISRRAMTGFLSLSRGEVTGEPAEIIRERWAARSTRSKRFSTLSTQSSTVTRAMGSPLGELSPLNIERPRQFARRGPIWPQDATKPRKHARIV